MYIYNKYINILRYAQVRISYYCLTTLSNTADRHVRTMTDRLIVLVSLVSLVSLGGLLWALALARTCRRRKLLPDLALTPPYGGPGGSVVAVAVAVAVATNVDVDGWHEVSH